MAEQYANDAVSTLNGAITSGATSLTVVSATTFPTTGNFRVLIDNEILLVTAVAGAVFTVTRGAESTTAASHVGGATVRHVLTVASLQELDRLAGGVLRVDPAAGCVGIGIYPPINLLHIVGTSATVQDINVSHSYADGLTFSGAHRPIRVNVTHNATDQVQGQVVSTGVDSNFNYGSASVEASGNMHAGTFSGIITGCEDALHEQAGLFVGLRYDIGTGYTNSATPGRAWLQDNSVHGAIGVQQSLLAGITQFINNYYNGAPSGADSFAIAAVTKPGTGGLTDATHQAATSYPVQVGFGVHGKSGTTGAPTGVGFTTAFQAGGTGSGWTASSIIGTAFYGRDVTVQGIKLDNPGAGSPKGIVISGATWGTLIDLSGVTTPPTAAILMPSSALQWNTDGGGNIGASAGNRPGHVYCLSTFNAAGGVAVLGGEASGGKLNMTRATTAATNPGANRGLLYFRDGTNATTLKLVARCGAGGAETTILDNIPTA